MVAIATAAQLDTGEAQHKDNSIVEVCCKVIAEFIQTNCLSKGKVLGLPGGLHLDSSLCA